MLCPSIPQSLSIQDQHLGLAVYFTNGQVDSMKPEANGVLSVVPRWEEFRADLGIPQLSQDTEVDLYVLAVV